MEEASAATALGEAEAAAASEEESPCCPWAGSAVPEPDPVAAGEPWLITLLRGGLSWQLRG